MQRENPRIYLLILKVFIFVSAGSHFLVQAARGGQKAEIVCETAFRKLSDVVKPTIVRLDPIEQLSLWETQYNAWKVPEGPLSIQLNQVKPSEIEVIASDVLNEQQLREALPFDPFVAWPKHPYTTSEVHTPIGTFYDKNGQPFKRPPTQAPFFDRPTVGDIKAKPTASRSLIIDGKNGTLFSLKLPTTNVSPTEKQIGRLDLIEEARMAPLMATYLNKIERQGRVPKNVIILKDVAVVIEKTSKNGYLIRDLTELKKSGNYFIPGFSLSTVSLGKKIDLKEVSQVLGKAYADFVLETGLQFETPHGQNILFEVTPDGNLTGRVAFRDLSDTFVGIPQVTEFWKMPESLADLVHLDKFPKAEPTIGYYSNLYADGNLVNESYYKRFDEVLGSNLVGIPPQDRNDGLSKLLTTPEGKAKLQKHLEGKN